MLLAFAGEQMFWWGLALFSCAQGQYWVLLGPLFNSLCMVRGSLLGDCQ